MMMKMILVALSIGLWSGRAPAQPANARSSMKGWELYSWFDMTCSAKPHAHSAPNDDSWCFALVQGTNRVKGDQEILEQRVGWRELVKRLVALKRGEQVFWAVDGVQFVLPGASVEKKLRAEIARLGLGLEVGKRPR